MSSGFLHCTSDPRVLKEHANVVTEPVSAILKELQKAGMVPENCKFTNVVQIFKRWGLVNFRDSISRHMTSTLA